MDNVIRRRRPDPWPHIVTDYLKEDALHPPFQWTQDPAEAVRLGFLDAAHARETIERKAAEPSWLLEVVYVRPSGGAR